MQYTYTVTGPGYIRKYAGFTSYRQGAPFCAVAQVDGGQDLWSLAAAKDVDQLRHYYRTEEGTVPPITVLAPV